MTATRHGAESAPDSSSTPAPSPSLPGPAPAVVDPSPTPPRRGRLLRAEIAARLAAPPSTGVGLAMAGILEQVARQLAHRGGGIG